jgi:hypothetical protein
VNATVRLKHTKDTKESGDMFYVGVVIVLVIFAIIALAVLAIIVFVRHKDIPARKLVEKYSDAWVQSVLKRYSGNDTEVGREFEELRALAKRVGLPYANYHPIAKEVLCGYGFVLEMLREMNPEVTQEDLETMGLRVWSDILEGRADNSMVTSLLDHVGRTSS